MATEAEVHRQSVWMGVFFAAFASSAFLLMRVFPLGATGLVIANSINMFCRIIWSASFIGSFFKKHGDDVSFRSVIPQSPLILSVITAALMYKLDVVQHAEHEPIVVLAKVASFALPLLLCLYVIPSHM